MSDFFNHKVTVPSFILNYMYLQVTTQYAALHLPISFRSLPSLLFYSPVHASIHNTDHLFPQFIHTPHLVPSATVYFLGGLTLVIGRPRESLPRSPRRQIMTSRSIQFSSFNSRGKFFDRASDSAPDISDI
jgi:hypothetical protein